MATSSTRAISAIRTALRCAAGRKVSTYAWTRILGSSNVDQVDDEVDEGHQGGEDEMQPCTAA
jgi:hypothetical protein